MKAGKSDTAMDSGIKVDSCCLKHIEDLEKRKYEFMIMQIAIPEGKSNKPCVVTKEILATKEECQKEVEADGVTLTKDETPTWYCFRKRLEKYDIAYGACYCDYKTNDGRESSKLVFITYNTDGAKMAEKMKYSSTKIYPKFPSGPTKHQAADKDDITYLEIVEQVIRRK